MSKKTEDDLDFIEVRKMSPQHEVFCKGERTALVTERYIATPVYAVVILKKEDKYFDTRQEVIDYLLENVNA
jgi:hypothetical protein